jgi:hypothetical protein
MKFTFFDYTRSIRYNLCFSNRCRWNNMNRNPTIVARGDTDWWGCYVDTNMTSVFYDSLARSVAY